MIAVFVASVCDAAPKPKKVTDPLERPSRDTENVFTDPAETDDDYKFVGEYHGYEWTTGSHRSSRNISLQLNAIGDGRFVATKMYGGTPAHRSTTSKPIGLEGFRSGHRVELIGPRLHYLVDGKRAYVLTERNIVVGKLERSGRVSPTLGRQAPEGAVVLFDGEGNDQLVSPRVTDDGLLKAGTQTSKAWGDFEMHIEFMLPYKPEAFGQHRGNSGVYIQSRYEVQILDSFGWVPAFNDCSSLYRTKRPDINATLPPLAWQTYDITFRAARFDDAGARVEPAKLTVVQNGITTHDGVDLPNKTGAGQQEGPKPLPTKFQDHRNPVVFRNVWLLPGDHTERAAAASSDTPPEPVPVVISPGQLDIVTP